MLTARLPNSSCVCASRQREAFAIMEGAKRTKRPAQPQGGPAPARITGGPAPARIAPTVAKLSAQGQPSVWKMVDGQWVMVRFVSDVPKNHPVEEPARDRLTGGTDPAQIAPTVPEAPVPGQEEWRMVDGQDVMVRFVSARGGYGYITCHPVGFRRSRETAGETAARITGGREPARSTGGRAPARIGLTVKETAAQGQPAVWKMVDGQWVMVGFVSDFPKNHPVGFDFFK